MFVTLYNLTKVDFYDRHAAGRASPRLGLEPMQCNCTADAIIAIQTESAHRLVASCSGAFHTVGSTDWMPYRVEIFMESMLVESEPVFR